MHLAAEDRTIYPAIEASADGWLAELCESRDSATKDSFAARKEVTMSLPSHAMSQTGFTSSTIAETRNAT